MLLCRFLLPFDLEEFLGGNGRGILHGGGFGGRLAKEGHGWWVFWKSIVELLELRLLLGAEEFGLEYVDGISEHSVCEVAEDDEDKDKDEWDLANDDGEKEGFIGWRAFWLWWCLWLDFWWWWEWWCCCCTWWRSRGSSGKRGNGGNGFDFREALIWLSNSFSCLSSRSISSSKDWKSEKVGIVIVVLTVVEWWFEWLFFDFRIVLADKSAGIILNRFEK